LICPSDGRAQTSARLSDFSGEAVSPVTATVRVMSPEEIAARAGGETPFLRLPERSTVFAERAMRLRQLARGHAMGDFLNFMADLAQAQQRQLARMPTLPLPDRDALDRAARAGAPPLLATDWPRDPTWHGVLRALVADLRSSAPAGVLPTLNTLAAADEVFLERQADALLHGVMTGLDLACAPLIAAALQCCFTELMLKVQAHGLAHAPAHGQPFGRIDDATACPCCGSRPVASVTRSSGESLGQRYLHCGLCSTEWHMVRIKCPHCLSEKSLAYQSLDTADADDQGSSRAAQAVLQAETCDECGHYLKIVHSDRDPMVEPLADDLASLTLDLLVSEAGYHRHGLNLMLLFGDPAEEASAAPPPDPGAP
jgi:FdhE protein